MGHPEWIAPRYPVNRNALISVCLRTLSLAKTITRLTNRSVLPQPCFIFIFSTHYMLKKLMREMKSI
jgi:hypothetical protein